MNDALPSSSPPLPLSVDDRKALRSTLEARVAADGTDDGTEAGDRDDRPRRIRGGAAAARAASASATRRTAITGPSAGLSVMIPTNDDGAIGIHYGYRTTNPFDGIHSIGLNISM